MTNSSHTEKDVAEIAAGSLHRKLAECHPSLSRGQVWCRTCGSTQRVDSAGALRHGWPKCCTYTMTIDSPEDQVRLRHLISTPDMPKGGEQ